MKSIKDNSQDIKKLKLFLDEEYVVEHHSKITGFSDVGKIYRATNEKMNLYPEEDLTYKKVLTITSSGDHALDAILCGAKEIDSIDINVFCKYFSALKMAMIKKYDYDEFFETFDLITLEITNAFLSGVLSNVQEYLTKEEIDFWYAYLKFKNGGNRDIFRTNLSNIFNNKFANRRRYYELKEKIKDVNITYYDGDIENVKKILNNNKYDCVYLSNVLERMPKSESRKKILQKLIENLNDDAVINNYFLGIDDISLNDVFKDSLKDIKETFNVKYYCDFEDENTCERGLIKLTLL